MGTLDDLNARINQIESRRVAIEKEIKALTIESIRLYKEQTLLTNEKYAKHLRLPDHVDEPGILSQVLYDATFSTSAAEALVSWMQSFGRNFLEGWGSLNAGGEMPSALLGFEEDEEITHDTLASISSFASIVHGGTGYAIFDIREYGYKTTGNWLLVVGGEGFNKAELMDADNMLDFDPDALAQDLEEVLQYVAENHWMI
jgi:hypothetical protein